MMFAFLNFFHGAEEMINIMPVTRKWKRQWSSGSENSQQNFAKQIYMFSFEGGTLLSRETVTMLRSRDVIHRGPASFWYRLHYPVSVVILVLKKKELLFVSAFSIYIYIYITFTPHSSHIYIYIYTSFRSDIIIEEIANKKYQQLKIANDGENCSVKKL